MLPYNKQNDLEAKEKAVDKDRKKSKVGTKTTDCSSSSSKKKK